MPLSLSLIHTYIHTQDLIQRFHECLEDVGHAQNMVTEELSNWKQSQRWLSLEDGSTVHGELSNIQKWFESLAELLWRLRQLAKQVCQCH